MEQRIAWDDLPGLLKHAIEVRTGPITGVRIASAGQNSPLAVLRYQPIRELSEIVRGIWVGDEGIGERDPHLQEQAGQVGVNLLAGCAPLGEEDPEGAVELGKDLGAP